MKKLLAILIATAFVVGCSSDKEPVKNTNELVVVKHCSSGAMKKHKKRNASMSSAKFGS